MSAKKLLGMSLVSICICLAIVAVMKRGHSSLEEETVDVQVKEAVAEEVGAVAAREVGLKLEPVHDAIANEEADCIDRFFTTGKDQFPIVQTIKYKSRVSWLKGKPAWIADYAAHYKTSRHFIARSLNREKDYLTQKVGTGDTFTVLNPDKAVLFYLVIDLSRCKMWFYYHDLDTGEKKLVKTYRVGLGRLDLKADSGVLTPAGLFWLGEKVAVYKPGVVDYFQGSEAEMVQIFGTRWLPLAKRVGGEEDIKGYGLHGIPWVYDEAAKIYVEDLAAVGSYTSDGCIRLKQEDIEELYAILITKLTAVEIVTDFQQAILPKISCKQATVMSKGGPPC
ncbi:MAG: L,D-transpeptidase [Chlamydiota bacterium]